MTSQFKAQMSRAKKTAIDIARASTINAGGQVEFRSPVDSGRFRNTWNTKIGGTDESMVEHDSLAVLIDVTDGLQPGQKLFFTNPLPYGPRLEYEAWSAQSPNGMVRIVAANWSQIVSKEAKAIKR